MPRSYRSLIAAAVVAGAAAWSSQALAWEDVGHRWVGTLGIQSLPSTLPAFLRTPQAAADVGEWAREPDRSKGSGRTHDQDRDPGHFADVDDNGKLLGGPDLMHLPVTRAEYEKQLQAAGTDSWKAGYLPYSLVEGWQQLVKDFAYWRADAYGEKTVKDPGRKAWLTQDRIRREAQLKFELGYWAHFVGDGSQPLHVTYHYNGWGSSGTGGPNPKGYTNEHIHGPFEGEFVNRNIKFDAVKAAIRPPADCGECDIFKMVGGYLTATSSQVETVYQLWGQGGFKDGDPRGTQFVTARIAEGAAELRDLVTAAWNASGKMVVGYPGVSAVDAEAGKAPDLYELLYGKH
jgi:hypothetical protein